MPKVNKGIQFLIFKFVNVQQNTKSVTGCLVNFPMVTKLIIIVNNCLQFISVNFNIIVVYNKVTDCGALESRDLCLFSKHILKSCLPRFILTHNFVATL